MNFIADLHIHSRFSRATSKQLSPRHLAAWARCKGINVLGTGDFTHPQWRDELRQQLVRDEASGLYRLSGPAEELDFLQGKTPPDADGPLFLLQTEISSIYKRQGKVRKVHNLIFVPTLDDADRLSQRLELVGNLHSDGRPILGLDSRDLLEMTLDVCPEAVLIPAHVWTPWFALFGSKSGFDRLEDCFDDLSSHIFALSFCSLSLRDVSFASFFECAMNTSSFFEVCSFSVCLRDESCVSILSPLSSRFFCLSRRAVICFSSSSAAAVFSSTAASSSFMLFSYSKADFVWLSYSLS